MILVPTSQAGQLGMEEFSNAQAGAGGTRLPPDFSLPTVPLPLASQDLTGVGIWGHLLCDKACPPLTDGSLAVTGHCHVHHPLTFSQYSREVGVNKNYYIRRQCLIPVQYTNRAVCSMAL